MFNLILDTMRSSDSSVYNDRLKFLFAEFRDLKYIVDPEYEINVICELIYILGVRSLNKNSSYAHNLWNKKYGCDIFDVDIGDNPSSEFSNKFIGFIDNYNFDLGGREFEMINALVCYAKARRYDIKNNFIRMIDKLETVAIK